MKTVEERLELLERSVRRWKGLSISLLLGLAAVACVAAEGDRNLDVDHIRAKSIIVEDAKSEVRIRCEPVAGAVVYLATKDGKAYARLSAEPGGEKYGPSASASVSTQEKTDGPNNAAEMQANGEGQLSLYKRQGDGRVKTFVAPISGLRPERGE